LLIASLHFLYIYEFDVLAQNWVLLTQNPIAPVQSQGLLSPQDPGKLLVHVYASNDQKFGVMKFRLVAFQNSFWGIYLDCPTENCSVLNVCQPPFICKQTCDYNGILSYSCVCPTGYKPFNSTCIDINECEEASLICGPNEICSNNVGGYTCSADSFCAICGIYEEGE